MKLIVGLGNPGREYKKNRHNIGFLGIDKLADKLDVDIKRRKFNARYETCSFENDDILLIKPQTYMNLSGHAVRSFVAYFKISVSDILVIVDDIHLAFETIRVRTNSSAGGHNGIQSVIEELGTKDFARLRVGVGKPLSRQSLKSYVLSDFNPEEMEQIPQLLDRVADASLLWLRKGVRETMQKYNGSNM
jgi:PTH1 family peptidyl-tRNA hydrolase